MDAVAREDIATVVPVHRDRSAKILSAAVVVSALGYFVDIYDLILFSIVRVESLTALGLDAEARLTTGVFLLNMQMGGMLVGGVLWGVLGDKRGRVSVLFGSILLYSLANLANAFVADVPTYAVLRFVAGVGLAGELGAAITLVTETLPKETRGYGTAIVAAVGLTGAVVGALVGGLFSWRVAYAVGGAMGLALLALRYRLRETSMFRGAVASNAPRGSLRLLFATRERTARWARCVLVGVPIWFVVGILVTFSPEISREMAVRGAVSAAIAVPWTYAGLALGDLGSGFLSQRVGRKRVMLGFLGGVAMLTAAYAVLRGLPAEGFYALCFLLGIAAGYWAVFVTNAAEQFGTNLRATVATTTPNVVRGAVVPLTLAFTALAPLGLATSALLVGCVSIVLALLALWGMEETRDKDLDHLET